jgi:hypothetical protein
VSPSYPVEVGTSSIITPLPVVTADALIRMGYMRHTVITPTPEKGKAVSLTTKGLTWLRNRSS